MLTFLWGSIKSLSFRWLSNDLYLIWKESRDYCKSSGYLLRDFWIPNLEVYLLHWRNIAKLEVFPISAGHWYGQPFDVIQGECLLYSLSGFQHRLLCKLSVSEISACQVPLKKRDSFNKGNLHWKLCTACQITKQLLTSRRRFKTNLSQVLIQLVIF